MAYDTGFYQAQQGGSLRSAHAVAPLIMDLLHPHAVVDIGCGVGTWLSVFKSLGVEHILGVDGAYVDKTMLMIPEDCFLPHDLSLPLALNKTFDLAVSLEVAEHLPDACAEMFVKRLVDLAPVVLFSAAIPFQGGTHHINEQWPEYWAQKFERHGYAVIDCIRPKIWNNPDIDWCYSQNAFLYANQDAIQTNPQLQAALEDTQPNQLALVHPRKYLEYCDPKHMSPKNMLRSWNASALGLPVILKNFIQRRLG